MVGGSEIVGVGTRSPGTRHCGALPSSEAEIHLPQVPCLVLSQSVSLTRTP